MSPLTKTNKQTNKNLGDFWVGGGAGLKCISMFAFVVLCHFESNIIMASCGSMVTVLTRNLSTSLSYTIAFLSKMKGWKKPTFAG